MNCNVLTGSLNSIHPQYLVGHQCVPTCQLLRSTAPTHHGKRHVTNSLGMIRVLMDKKSGQPVYILEFTDGLMGNKCFNDIFFKHILIWFKCWSIPEPSLLIDFLGKKTHCFVSFLFKSIKFLKTPTNLYDFPAPCVEPSVVLPTLRWSCGVANAWRSAGPWFGWFRGHDGCLDIPGSGWING